MMRQKKKERFEETDREREIQNNEDRKLLETEKGVIKTERERSVMIAACSDRHELSFDTAVINTKKQADMPLLQELNPTLLAAVCLCCIHTAHGLFCCCTLLRPQGP